MGVFGVCIGGRGVWVGEMTSSMQVSISSLDHFLFYLECVFVCGKAILSKRLVLLDHFISAALFPSFSVYHSCWEENVPHAPSRKGLKEKVQ